MSKNCLSKMFIYSLLLVFIGSLFTQPAFAQIDVIIGAGAQAVSGNTSTADAGPIYRSSATSTFDYSVHHHLFTATELASIPSGASITKLSWYKTNIGATTGAAQKFNIYMKNSALNNVSAPSQNLGTLISGATLVYSATSQIIPTTVGWIEFNLSTPFIYNGGSIEITLDWDISNVAGNPTTGAFVWKSDLINNRVISYVGATPSTGLVNARGARAQTRFTYIGGNPCNGTPTPGNTVVSTSTICSNVPFTLSLQNIVQGLGVSYQWYANANPIAGATNSSVTTTLTTTTNYACAVTCNASGITTNSNPLSLSPLPFDQCYCVPFVPQNPNAFSYISNVTFESIRNETPFAPTTSPYLTSFSMGLNTSASVIKGNTYPLSVTATGQTQVAMWVDWDQNGFYDANEYTFLGTSIFTGNAVYTQNITVPVSAASGTTKMRIRSKGSSAATFTANDACSSVSDGETEDYYLTIYNNTPCNATPTPGNTLSSATNTCINTLLYFGLSNPGLAPGISYQWHKTAGPIAGATNYYYSGLFAGDDDYWCQVTCLNSGLSTNSSPIHINQNAPSSCYCIPVSTFGCSGEDVIARFKLNTLDNNTGTACPSGTVGYTNFAGNALLTTTLQRGQVYTAEATPGPVWGQGFAVWIDYNDNGSFDDAGEKVGFTPTSINGGGIGIFPVTIACNATLGVHRLRIRSQYATPGANITSCGAFALGEVEDYSVTITTAASCGSTSATTANNITPFTATISWVQGCGESLWDVHVAPYGSGIPTGTPSHAHVQNNVMLSGLQPSTSYEVYVRAVCDSTTNAVSSWSPVYYFQTAIGPCTGTPSNGITSATASIVCSTSNLVDFYVVGLPTNPGITYQWFGNGNAIAGATNSTYQGIDIPGTTSFYCQATCSNSGLSSNSIPATVTVNIPGVGTSLSNPILIGQAPCASAPYLNTQINSNTNCFYNTNTSVADNQVSADVYYQFTLSSAATVNINTCTSSFDTYLHLLNSSGVQIKSNDDSCNLMSMIVTNLPAGTYYIVTEGYGGAMGAINLSVSTLPTNTTQVELITACNSYTWPATGITYTASGNYTATSMNSTCGIHTQTLQLTINPCTITLNLTCFIQGYWDDALHVMNPALANQGILSGGMACDSIEVELHDANNYAFVTKIKALLLQNGTANCVFPGTIPYGNYFIVVKHRNAIETWSSGAVALGANSMYDFSSAASQAYGSNQVLLSSAPVVYGFYSGDVLKDAAEAIDLLDLGKLEAEINNFSFGYFPEDINGDGNVDLMDIVPVEININQFIFSAHP